MEIRFKIFNLLINNTYLGDPYQQIYMFRGAVNALGKEYYFKFKQYLPK